MYSRNLSRAIKLFHISYEIYARTSLLNRRPVHNDIGEIRVPGNTDSAGRARA